MAELLPVASSKEFRSRSMKLRDNANDIRIAASIMKLSLPIPSGERPIIVDQEHESVPIAPDAGPLSFYPLLNKALAEHKLIAVAAAADAEDDHIEAEYTPNTKRLSTLSIMSTESAFDKTRGMRSRKGSSKSDRVAATPKNVQASPSKDVVGDRILNSYPDRNPLETGFPIHHSRFSTPELDNFYNVVRKRIVVAVHEEGFRRGAFKPDISSGHGSVQHVVLQMQLSGEISKEQFKILVTFGRKWCAAIGDSFDRKAYPILDNDFIAESGVETATEDLFAMLDEEFKNPNPYPLPDDIKYKDSATLLKIAANADEKKKAEEEAAGSVAVAAFSDNDVSSSKNDASGPSFTTIFLRDGISKPRLLAKLKEYDAANSKDAVLRRAWEEISKHKGELTAASIDGLTEPTAKLIWDQIQSESAALNAPIPMGASLNATIAKLETMQLNTSPSSSKAALNLYAPPKESMTSKMKKFVKGKGKGKENQ